MLTMQEITAIIIEQFENNPSMIQKALDGCSIYLGRDVKEGYNEGTPFSKYKINPKEEDFSGIVSEESTRLSQVFVGGEQQKLHTFETKEDLLKFLNSRYEKSFDYAPKELLEDISSKEEQQEVNDYCQDINDEYFASLSGDESAQQTGYSDDQKSLVVFKSRFFHTMNFMWGKFGKAGQITPENIDEMFKNAEEFKNDSRYLSMYDKERYLELREYADAVYQLGIACKLYEKAKQNPQNAKFFEENFPDIDFSNPKRAAMQLTEQMQKLEQIPKVKLDRDIKLARGVYGTVESESPINSSQLTSFSPDFQTAVDFANQKGNGFQSREGNKTLFVSEVKKGTEVIPLMMSVRMSVSGMGDANLNLKEIEKLAPEDIVLGVEKCQQPEVVLPSSAVKVTTKESKFSEVSSEYGFGSYVGMDAHDALREKIGDESLSKLNRVFPMGLSVRDTKEKAYRNRIAYSAIENRANQMEQEQVVEEAVQMQ